MNLRLFRGGLAATEALPLLVSLYASLGEALSTGTADALSKGDLECLVAQGEKGLEGLAAFGALPSLYTGRPWGHIDLVAVRDEDEAVATSLVAGAVHALAALGAVEMSLALPAHGGPAERAGRAHGFGDEELGLHVRHVRGDLPTDRPDDVQVRSATPDDAGTIAELVRLFADEYGEPCGADLASVLRYFRTDRVGALVASLDDEIVGLLAFSSSFHPSFGRCATVDDLVVRRTARRRGVASALVDEAMVRTCADGAERVSLWLQPDNTAAEALYRRHGFCEEGRVLVRHPSRRLTTSSE